METGFPTEHLQSCSVCCYLISANHPILIDDGEDSLHLWSLPGCRHGFIELLSSSGGFLMIQDVLALEGFLMEPLPSHLRSALGLCFPSVLFQMGSLENLQPGQGPASGVYLGKDMWHPGRVRSKAGIGWLRSQEPGRGQEVWQESIWGLSPSCRHHLPGQELSWGG